MRLTWPDRSLPDAIRDGLTGPGAPFELVTEDVLGVPMQVFKNRPRNLRDMLEAPPLVFRDRPYIVFPERAHLRRDPARPVAAVARTLAEKYGVGEGDRVAIAAANCAEYAITFWAATALGAITVAMNGWWTGSEMTYALELTKPTVLLGDRRRIERLDGEPEPATCRSSCSKTASPRSRRPARARRCRTSRSPRTTRSSSCSRAAPRDGPRARCCRTAATSTSSGWR